MKTVQAKFFEVLEARAKDAGLEVVVDYTHASVGRIHLQPEGSFETAFDVGFNFQSGSPCVHFDARRPVFRSRPNPTYAGFDAGELDEAVETILEAAQAPA